MSTIFLDRHEESLSNAGLSVVSPEGVKLTEQGIAIPLADGAIFPNRSQETLWRPARNRECSVGTDRVTVVLMAGLPGVGKSTLAYALQNLLGWQVIDKDRYKEKLFKGYDDAHAAQNAYNYSFEKMRTAVVKQHASVILDSAALRQFILDETMKIASDVPNALVKVILCVASRDLRVKRLDTRLQYHPNPKVDTTADVSDFYHFGHLPKGKDELLVIDTGEPFAECLAKARKYVLS